jgi:aminoglycoside phosphotransferase (APT) family kinase protein
VHVIESAANALRSRNHLSLVMEHGDCGHPNILVDRIDHVSAVDWESALGCGMPAADLFFFLSFVASATDGAQTVAQHVRAFEKAFFRRDSWARKYIKTYVEQTGFDAGLLLPVFVLTWCRYLSARLARVRARSGGAEPTMEQITSDQYYAFVRYTLQNVQDLAWIQHVEER